MAGLAEDADTLAQDLRTIADRIEDGEYVLTGMSARKPGPNGDPNGQIVLSIHTEEQWNEMKHVYQNQSVGSGE